jgi:hypothetical protein
MIERKKMLSNIYGVLKNLSDKEYQERVWLRGEGPEVSSYEELINTLFDDFYFDELLEDNNPYNISQALFDKLINLRLKLNNYNDKDSDGNIKEVIQILNDSEWIKIQKLSSEVLPLLKEEIGGSKSN